MPRALMLAHEAEYGTAIAGHVGDELIARGFDLHFHGILQEEGRIDLDLPPVENFDLIVVFGSFHHAYDEADQHWLEVERQWIASAIDADVPYLGICFGAQLLAQVLGGEVRSAGEVEAGVMTMEAVAPCPVPLGPWFTWHGDVMDLPASAELLAVTKVGPQIYRQGKAMGVQFHPEATMELVRDWLDAGGDHLDAANSAEMVWEQTQAAAEATKANCVALVEYLIEEFVHS